MACDGMVHGWEQPDLQVYFAATPSRADASTEWCTVGGASAGGGGAEAPPESAATQRRLRRQRFTQAVPRPARSEEEPAQEVRPEEKEEAQIPKAAPSSQARKEGGDAECQLLMQQLNAGGEARCAAMAAIQADVRALAFQSLGCRAVQLALQVADQAELKVLIEGLRGSVRLAIASPHGNYVVQKAVETVPSDSSGFIADELSGVGAECARHRYGCRVLCRLLEHTSSSKPTLVLMDEVLMQADDLCRHTFGHFVIEALLEHGQPEQRRAVAASLLQDLPRSARNRSASRVVEKALELCEGEDRRALAEGLLGAGAPEGELAQLARSHFGTHVVRALARLPGQRDAVLRQLQSALPDLHASKNAQRLLSELGLAARTR